jgi:hypothetical protein
VQIYIGFFEDCLPFEGVLIRWQTPPF